MMEGALCWLTMSFVEIILLFHCLFSWFSSALLLRYLVYYARIISHLLSC